MTERIKNEPALVTALVTAILACAVSFGLPLTDGQQGSVIALVTAALAVCGVATRQQVTPTRKVAAQATDPDSDETVAGEASDLPVGAPADVVPAQDDAPEPEAYQPRHADTEATSDLPTAEDATTGVYDL